MRLCTTTGMLACSLARIDSELAAERESGVGQAQVGSLVAAQAAARCLACGAEPGGSWHWIASASAWPRTSRWSAESAVAQLSLTVPPPVQ